MTTTIHSNGSRHLGEQAATIAELLDVLGQHALDRTFEAYGNFIEASPAGTLFFGNFHSFSHVFRITTDDPDVFEPLTAAIRENMSRDDYQRQLPPYRPELLTIERKRFSETQGEVLLTYNGERLDQYGDAIVLTDGVWNGHPDSYWHDAARRVLARRHEASWGACIDPAA
ncbi:hypothetical protein [Sphingosinicella sp. BN140058]|uniref:hypothetical protein n=1 Tax=Sphingosinicella sp. BN140058 TaxID=1892855 RepID=UPI0010115BD5|nr:hypothetical protein [Sphingosinicella sp. BN140058]QAY80368.1 hypothetical protein ETR14_27390 [Sphingosinicella sp. BN140058]